MAIQHRRGPDRLFDAEKIVAAELAVSLDEEKVYIGFGPNNAKELAQMKHIDKIVGDVSQYYELAKQEANRSKSEADKSKSFADDSANSANSSESFSQESEDFSILSESFAKGNTDSREGEDTDNAKYYKEQAEDTLDMIEDTFERKLPLLSINFETGNVEFVGGILTFEIDSDGMLLWYL